MFRMRPYVSLVVEGLSIQDSKIYHTIGARHFGVKGNAFYTTRFDQVPDDKCQLGLLDTFCIFTAQDKKFVIDDAGFFQDYAIDQSATRFDTLRKQVSGTAILAPGSARQLMERIIKNYDAKSPTAKRHDILMQINQLMASQRVDTL